MLTQNTKRAYKLLLEKHQVNKEAGTLPQIPAKWLHVLVTSCNHYVRQGGGRFLTRKVSTRRISDPFQVRILAGLTP